MLDTDGRTERALLDRMKVTTRTPTRRCMREVKMFILYLHIRRSKLSSDSCYGSGCYQATKQDGWWGGKRMFRGSKEQAEIVLSFEGGYVSLSKMYTAPIT